MGIYDKFKNATPMSDRNWIEPGIHIFLIRRAEMGPSKNPLTPKAEKCVMEFKIIASDTMKVGNNCAFVDTDKNPLGGYLGNVLELVAGIMGYSVDVMKADPTFDAVFDGVFGVQQIFTETLVKCTAQMNAAKTYTNKKWEPVLSSDYAKYGLIAPDGAYTGEEEAAAAA